MTKYIPIAKKSEIPKGKMKEFKLEDKTIAIANSDGEYFAFDGICTHAHCALAGGYLDGYTVTCYCHGAQFDVSSGQVLAPPAQIPLKTYTLKVEREDILIEI